VVGVECCATVGLVTQTVTTCTNYTRKLTMEELANSDLSKKNSRHNRRGNDSGGKESI